MSEMESRTVQGERATNIKKFDVSALNNVKLVLLDEFVKIFWNRVNGGISLDDLHETLMQYGFIIFKRND